MDGIVLRRFGASCPVNVLVIWSRVMVDCAAGVASVDRTALTTTVSSVSRPLLVVSRGAPAAPCAIAAVVNAEAKSAAVNKRRTNVEPGVAAAGMAGSLRRKRVMTIRSALARRAQKNAPPEQAGGAQRRAGAARHAALPTPV